MMEALQSTSVETHLVVSDTARLTISKETDWTVENIFALANYCYSFKDFSAAIASGSFVTWV
jgi:4-hydroxy-3-polyprenylbenzoate decarboxylase